MRIAATAVVGFSSLRFGDAGPYLFAASEIAQHGRYPDRTEAYFFRPPAYPLLLAAVTGGRADRIPAAKVANALLGAVSAVLLAALSARIFGRRGIALATGVAAAVFPSLVLLATDVQSEPLFMVFFLLAGLFLLAAADRASPGAALAAGAALGLAALTRPSALALAPLLAAFLLDRRIARRPALGLTAAALAGLVLCLAPWTLRNAVRFHELIPISDAGGVSLYAGNSAWTRSFYRVRTREEYLRWLDDFDRDLKTHLAQFDAQGKTSPATRSAAYARLGIDESLANPAASARLMALKAWHWVRPYPTPWYWPAPVVAAVGVLYVGLYVLTARGLIRAPRRGVTVFCLAVLVLSMAAHVALQVVWRYRVPYWDPVLLLYGTFGAARR